MSIAAKPDKEQQMIQLTKSLLQSLISDERKNSTELVEHFDSIIKECSEYAKGNIDNIKLSHTNYRTVCYLIDDTEDGKRYFRKLDPDKIDNSVYEKIISLFDEWKSSFERSVDYQQEQKDKMLRLQAEFDNYRKRVQKDKAVLEGQIKYNTLSGIIDIIDDLELAKKNEPKNEGIQLIFSKLESYLQSQGAEEIDCSGDFDSDSHECISAIDVKGVKPNQIVEVIKKGYSINGTIVRYPKVIVSK